jgi:hypothetical protein
VVVRQTRRQPVSPRKRLSCSVKLVDTAPVDERRQRIAAQAVFETGGGRRVAALPLEAQLLRQDFERLPFIGVGVTVALVVFVLADPDEVAVVTAGEFEAEGKRPLQC